MIMRERRGGSRDEINDRKDLKPCTVYYFWVAMLFKVEIQLGFRI
jgi:hypothetical protein